MPYIWFSVRGDQVKDKIDKPRKIFAPIYDKLRFQAVLPRGTDDIVYDGKRWRG